MRRFFPFLILCSICLHNRIYAQYSPDPIRAQFFNNYLVINPAFSGSIEKNEIQADYYHETVFINSSPFIRYNTTTITYGRYLKKIRSGMTLSFQNKREKFNNEYFNGGGVYGGRHQNKNANEEFVLNYAYSFRITIKHHKLIPAVSFSFLRHRFRVVRLNFYNSDSTLNYQGYPENYDFNHNNIYGDVGLWYQYKNFNFGFSTKQLLLKALTEKDISVPFKSYIFSADYFYDFSKVISLKPIFLLEIQKSNNFKPWVNQIVGLQVSFKKIFAMGLSYNLYFIQYSEKYKSHYLSPYVSVAIKKIVFISCSTDLRMDKESDFGKYPFTTQLNLKSIFL